MIQIVHFRREGLSLDENIDCWHAFIHQWILPVIIACSCSWTIHPLENIGIGTDSCCRQPKSLLPSKAEDKIIRFFIVDGNQVHAESIALTAVPSGSKCRTFIFKFVAFICVLKVCPSWRTRISRYWPLGPLQPILWIFCWIFREKSGVEVFSIEFRKIKILKETLDIRRSLKFLILAETRHSQMENTHINILRKIFEYSYTALYQIFSIFRVSRHHELLSLC